MKTYEMGSHIVPTCSQLSWRWGWPWISDPASISPALGSQQTAIPVSKWSWGFTTGQQVVSNWARHPAPDLFLIRRAESNANGHWKREVREGMAHLWSRMLHGWEKERGIALSAGVETKWGKKSKTRDNRKTVLATCGKGGRRVEHYHTPGTRGKAVAMEKEWSKTNFNVCSLRDLD